MERGSHLRIQQDSAEYQKPLKIFQIPEEASSTLARSNGKSLDKSLPLGIMSPQVEDNSHETPLGCEGWTGEMEKHAKSFLRSADLEQAMARLHWLYPMSKSMTGLTRTLEQLKREIEAQESDQVQNERTSEQPAGWTNEMTDFVEGSLCSGNDVKATVNLLRLEKAEAFDIQGLEEHVEKLKNEHINKKNVRVQQDQVPQEPFGRPDRVTAVVQGRGLVNASKGRRLAHKAFATRQTVSSSGSTQVPQSGSQKQGIDPQEGSSGGSSQQQHPSDQPNGWTDKLTNIVREELRLSCDVGVDFLGHVLRYNHDFETNDIQCLNKYLEKLRQEVKAEQVHRSDGPKNAEDENISGIGGVRKNAENLKNEHKTQVPEMPVGWTDVMTDTVKDMLRLGDDIGFIEEVIKEDLDLQTTNPASLEKWFKKLESDYEAEVEDRMEQE